MKGAPSSLDRPFWLREPWSILFDLERLEKREVWSIDIAGLLASFLDELRRRSYVNFAVPGVALLSSAIVHRIKSELVLRLEEPPKPPPPERTIPEGVIPIIPLPVRYEYGSLTIEELLKAIKDILALKPEAASRTSPFVGPLDATAIPIGLPSLDPYLVKIEELTDGLYQRLMELLKDGALVPFSKVIEGLPRREALITFLALLFLACQGRLNLWQEEELGEIYIRKPSQGIALER